MNQELPPGLEDDEIGDLAQLVADRLAKGDPAETVASTLVENGWQPDQAMGFVGSIEQQLRQPQTSGGERSEVQGWMLWIGAIIGINFLSWLFNWGFWIY